MDKKERRVVVERVAKEKGAYKGRKTEGQGEGRGVCRMKKKSVTHVFPAKKKQDPTSGCLLHGFPRWPRVRITFASGALRRFIDQRSSWNRSIDGTELGVEL